MAGDVTALAFMQARLPLIDYHGTDANARKHAEDRTVSLARKWAGAVDSLKAARAYTMSCLEATEGKGGAVVLKIADKPRFDALQQAIAGHQEQITSLEQAIVRLDDLVQANGIAPGYLVELQQRISGSKSSIYRQRTAITNLSTFYTQQNPRMSPEDVLKLPEFVKKRGAAEAIIKQDEAYLEKMKPIADQIEAILESVGC